MPAGLVTEDGRHLRVVYPGLPNARGGPDFHDAKITDEAGQVVAGDVELHLKAPDSGTGTSTTPTLITAV